MSKDQIQLPEPDGYVWCDEFEGGCFVYAHEVRPTSATSVFNATTVRRLIAEAVAAQREACIAALEPLHQRWLPNIRDRYVVGECAAAIRSRGDQT